MIDRYINSKNIDKYKSGSVITLPAEADAINILDFREYKDIENIYVSPENKYFSSADGVLFNKDKTRIFFCPSAKKKIFIPAEVEKIERSAFELWEDLEEINVDERNQFYSSVDGILFSKDKTYLIYCPKNKKHLAIPDGTITITDDYFSALTMSSITSINIPASVKEIVGNPFSNLNNLEEINVDEQNQFFSSVDGMLFSKDKTRLIACPSAKRKLSIPAEVKIIDCSAFEHCKNLEEINVDGRNQFYASFNGVLLNKEKTRLVCCPFLNATNTILADIQIIDGVLYNADRTHLIFCSNKEIIEIESSVNVIEKNAFKNCKDVKIIVFEHKDQLPIIHIDDIGKKPFNSKALHIKISEKFRFKLSKYGNWEKLGKYCAIDYYL